MGIPARVERVYAAGPPASVLAFAVAPDKLIGWTSHFRDDERPFIAPKYANLPALGCLTGRGNTANVEVVIAARPDLIFDYGAVTPAYVSLANRVQAQTGIPYVLLDGDFDRMADSMEQFGRIVGEEKRGADLARYARDTIADIARRVATIPPARRSRVYYGRGPRGLDTGDSRDRSTLIRSSRSARRTSRRNWGAAGSCRCPWSRCCAETPA